MAAAATDAATAPGTDAPPTDPLFADPGLAPVFADWLMRRGDDALILGHRTSEWCGRGPALEEDIALANTALDLVGHAQMWLSLAAEVEGKGRSADDLAYLRDASAFRNLHLLEVPNGDIGRTLMRELLFDAWHFDLLTALQRSASPRVAEIAAKARKEAAYHLERAADLVIRLGDGTEESHGRMQAALNALWPYAGEMFLADPVDDAVAAAGIAPDPATLRAGWQARIEEVMEEATLRLPDRRADVHKGGRQGRHTEHLGFLLAEMQFLQRAYPGATW